MSEMKIEALRDYQLELVYKINDRKSCILFLPAGSGKTHIAFRVIKSMVADLRKPMKDNRKKTFFLVNTVHLVHQQGAVLTRQGNFQVSCLAGDVGLDGFRKNHWTLMLNTSEVLVMTSQIFLNALIHGYLSLESVNLLILDECHHATGGHPMAQIMNRVRECHPERRPKVLGLTATLLKANLKNAKIDFEGKLKDLERVFDGHIITSRKCKEVRDRFSAKPTELIVNVEKYQIPDNTKESMKAIFDESMKILQLVKIRNDFATTYEEKDKIQLDKPDSNRLKLLRNVLRDILIQTNEYGLFMGYTCSQYYIIQLYRCIMLTSREPRYVTILLYTMNQVRMMRKILFEGLMDHGSDDNPLETIEMIQNTSSNKIQYLFNRILKMSSADRCIVFVERKMTAKSLYEILKIFIGKHLNGKISIDFIIGTNKNPLRNTRDGLFDRKKKREILKNFRTGLTNVLVATNILEEGVDVQECNIVIMFDGVKTFPSYIQSRGRARMKGSEYIILNHASSPTDERVNFFRQIDSKLNDTFDKKEVPISYGKDNPHEIIKTNNTYTTSKGAKVDTATALQIVYLYCSTLPGDSCVQLMPHWYYDRDKGTCSVKLPSTSGIRCLIEGPRRSNRKEAKQAAALETIIRLHKSHILDDYLHPLSGRNKMDKRRFDDLDEDDVASVTLPSECNKIHFQITQCYLHCIVFKSEDRPSIARQIFCHELMVSEKFNFGILTRNPWPEICNFPVYSDLGEIHVEIQTNYQTLYYTAEKLKEISKYHRTLFMRVMDVVRKNHAYDDGLSNGYFIVPLRKNEKTKAYEISFRAINVQFPTDISKPSAEDIDNQEYIAKNYVGKVVTQWYKPESPHIVCEVSDKVFMSSRFVTSSFKSYEEYFYQKHNVKSRRPNNQPMLLVRPMRSFMDDIKPKPMSIAEKNRRKTMKDNETYLAPEFCYVYPVPAVFWYKSTILTSVLHRIHSLLIAEDLRQRIVNEAKVGSLKLPKDEDESTIKHFKAIDGRDIREKALNPKPENAKQLVKVRKRVSMRLYNLLYAKRRKADNKTENLKNIIQERDMATRRTVEIYDYEHPDVKVSADASDGLKTSIDYFDIALVALMKAQNTINGSSLFKKISRHGIPEIDFSHCPKLRTLEKYAIENGPKAHQILEAITVAEAQDVFNYERLETLGDSCLKYTVSVSLFLRDQKMDEGGLTIMKGSIVSNQHLLKCGKELNIGSYIRTMSFSSSRTFWSPPGFSIPPCFLGNQPVEGALVDAFSSLSSLEIPLAERFSGEISENTRRQTVTNRAIDNVNTVKEIDYLLGRHKLIPKNISDVLEALLGVYTLNTGIRNAFKLLQYFGILKTINLDMFDVPRGISCPEDSIYTLIPEFKRIEHLMKYTFKNKAYLLEAMTHPSFTGNSMTDSYEKLEFLGDAILDFLITSYIYEYCGNLDPGQLTDLRSALVNNITFGSLTVRLGLQQFLLCTSEYVLEAIETFVKFQKAKNHSIVLDKFMTVTNENNNIIAEEIEVPKALGDIFESLAAAVFLDSEFDLEVVWRIYYNFMKNEIDKFSRKVPINPVRELYENPQKNHLTFSSMESQNKSLICVTVKTAKGKIFQYTGRGENGKAAKRAAARLALQNLGKDAFMVSP